jgi:hypothetical protein
MPVDINHHLDCLIMGHDVIAWPTLYDVQWGAHQEMPTPYGEQASAQHNIESVVACSEKNA